MSATCTFDRIVIAGRASHAGFTLVELLTVIAIIGLLAGLLVPTVAGARHAANRARTRTQFSQWAAGGEAFRQEYGTYPRLASAGPDMRINHAADTDPGGEHRFHDTLTGQRRDPAAAWSSTRPERDPPYPERQNARRIRFLAFGESDFVTSTDVADGHNPASEFNFMRDAFHGTDIAMVTDANLDGVINAQDVPGGFPAVAAKGSGVAIRPAALIPEGRSGGLHAGMLFYTAPPGATTEEELILSVR